MTLRQRLLRPTLHAIAHRGWPATLRSLLAPVLRPLGLATRSIPLDPYPRTVPLSPHPFDDLHHVDTSGYLRGDQLHTPAGQRTPLHGAALWSTAYFAIAPSLFDQALTLATAAIAAADPAPGQDPLARFTFVDLGCGKARALLLASRHPFRDILGVELDPTLAAIASNNLHHFRAPWQRCHHLRVLHADARTVDLPPTAPTLLFLYNPFLAPVLRRVLHRLEASLQQHPRELWLLYINPEAERAIPRTRFIEHTRTFLHVAPEDALPDRLGHLTEEVALFRHVPQPHAQPISHRTAL